jgi:hypothetical protein
MHCYKLATDKHRYNISGPHCIVTSSTGFCSLANEGHSYIAGILGFKLSLLLSYLRFMPKGAARNATVGVIIACILFRLTFLLVQVNLCQPVSRTPTAVPSGAY